ncbi:MAG: phage holin family protein [Clostridia bacterium]|nr:phage holin family protein [Clostridia bacterium]
MDNNKAKNSSNQMSVGSIIARFITSAIVLAVTAFFTPGFEIASLWTLLLAAVVLAVMDYLINMVIGVDATPFGRGIIGFVVSVVVLYATQFFVAGYTISWISAIVGALIYGIVASIVPGKQTM